MKIYAFLHHPPVMSLHTGMTPLVEAVGATPVYYDYAYRKLQSFSWTLGRCLQCVGNWWAGSDLNILIPFWDEMRFIRAVEAPGPSVAHFLWGDTASPKRPRAFRRKGAALVGTFHASRWRFERAMRNFKGFSAYDWITVVSQSIVPLIAEQGFPEERVRTILLGVDTDFFNPGPSAVRKEGPLQALLVGQTERDHAFMADVMRRMPANLVRLSVLTPDEQKVHYRDVPGVTLLGRLSDDELVSAYRSADLLTMPMIDCTANDAILESMACGTPVLANRIGGIPEYVSASSSYMLDEKKADDWVDLLVHLSRNRTELLDRRGAVRKWAETFAWPKKAEEYLAVYRAAIKTPG